jgi:DNA-binding beta-propeller fold protein YncE
MAISNQGKWRTVVLRAALLAVCACTAVSGASAAEPAWSVLQRFTIGGAGGWDYLTLDAAGARLYISRGDHVDVLDTSTGRVVGSIPDTKGVHGIALAPDLKQGYTSNGKGDSVTVFDLATLAVIKEFPVPGHNPDAILYEAGTHRLFTFNGKSKDVTVFDANTLALVATLPVPDKPEFAVADGRGRVYLNIESEAGQMVVIDSKALKVAATWPLPGCASPSGLAMDKTHRRLFSVCDGRVMVVTDADNGKQVAKVAIGEGPDAAAYDAKRGLVWSSNGEGSLTAVRQESADRYAVAATIATQAGARTMALDEAAGKLYLVTAEFGPKPAPTADQPRPRAPMIPDTFTVLVVGQK